jgi:hypothetical protein
MAKSEAMSVEHTYTFREFQSEFLPNQILSRLEKHLMMRVGLSKPWQHALRPSVDIPQTGTVEIAKGFLPHSAQEITTWVANFYHEEKYNVQQTYNLYVVSPEGQKFLILVHEADTSFVIFVTKQ